MTNPYDPAGLSLEQLLVLDAIAREGSFTAAAKSMRRTQGSVSYHVERLEQQLGVTLFDRTGRRPVMTDAGRRALVHARLALAELMELRLHARTWTEGLEPRLRFAVDILFPAGRIAALMREVQTRFPSVELHLSTGIVRFAADAVRAKTCDLALCGPLGVGDLESHPAGSVRLVPVASPKHPLANAQSIDDSTLAQHTHLLLSTGDERPEPSEGYDSPRRWRLTDARLRLELLLHGVGWARLTEWEAMEHLERGRLVTLDLDDVLGTPREIPLVIAASSVERLGTAGRWVWEQVISKGA